MKKVILSIIAAITALSVSGCGEKKEEAPVASAPVVEELTVPDIVGTEESVAKNILSSNGLIPVVETEYSNDVEAGKIIRTSPNVGQTVEKNGKVTIYVSKGVSYIEASNANMVWYSVANEKDEWYDMYVPYIKEGKMYITVSPMFKADVKWHPYEKESGGVGRASINDTFDKTVPVRIITSQESLKKGERGTITLEIPVSDLDVQQPTTLYVQLGVFVNGNEVNQKYVNLSFAISW